MRVLETPAPAPAAAGSEVAPERPRLVTIGLIGGLTSDLLGVGGGGVMIPLMVLWLGLPQRLAHAISLAAIIPISAAGAISYYLDGGHIELLPAAALGARRDLRRPGRRRPAGADPGAAAEGDFRPLHADRRGSDRARGLSVESLPFLVAAVAFGVLTGVLSGLLGVGGGIFMVPFLVLLGGSAQQEAQATSLLVVLPMATAATWSLQRAGVGDLSLSLRMGLIGVAGAVLALVLPAACAAPEPRVSRGFLRFHSEHVAPATEGAVLPR